MIYNSLMRDEAIGAVDFDNDTFYVMLVNGYTPDKKNHKRRSDVTGEIVADGYTAGGQAVAITVTEDDVNDLVEISLGGAVWNPSTISATAAVYYKRRGGVASDDELVYCNEFGIEASSTNGAFTLASSMIRKTT
jgi:hypothetical protein